MAFRSALLVLIAFMSMIALVAVHPVHTEQPVNEIISDLASLKEVTHHFIALSRKDLEHMRTFNELMSELVAIKNAPTGVAEKVLKVMAISGKLDELTAAVNASKAMKFELEAKYPSIFDSEYISRRNAVYDNLENVVNFTFVPPPKVDITPELLNQSLTVQPQNTATVGSVIPYFNDGVISFHVQLNGLVASTMVLNASTSLPCDTIGSTTQPNLVLSPKNIKNGTIQAVVPDCHIIAVNIYRPTVINYWVQKEDGSVFALVSDNKVHNLDQINTNMDASLIIRSDVNGNLQERGMVAPDAHTATMTQEVCKGMSCINNNGKSAVYNPFTRACWCIEPAYVEFIPSGPGNSK